MNNQPLNKISAQKLLHSYFHKKITLSEHAMSGRNRLFVFSNLNKKWILKQNFVGNSESWFYGSFKELYYVPELLLINEKWNTIAVEYIENSKTLAAVGQESPIACLNTLSKLSSILSHLHSQNISSSDAPTAQKISLDIDPVYIDTYILATPALQQFTLLMQKHDIARRLKIKLALTDSPKGLIHNDLKIDNILIENSNELKIIDWELSGVGDLAWDLASIIGSMILVWSNLLAINSKRDIEDWVKEGGMPFELLSSSIREFVNSYNIDNKRLNRVKITKETLAVYTASWIVYRTWSEASQMNSLTQFQLVRLIIVEGLLIDPKKIFRKTEL